MTLARIAQKYRELWKDNKERIKKMKKMIIIILVTILTLSPNKGEANEVGLYKGTQAIEAAPKQNKDDYHWYDEERDEMILVNDRLEPDQNSDRDFLLKNKKNLNKYDLMELDFLNVLATGDREQTISTILDIIGRLNDDIINQKNGDLLHLQRWYTFHLYRQVYED